MEVLMRELKEY